MVMWVMEVAYSRYKGKKMSQKRKKKSKYITLVIRAAIKWTLFLHLQDKVDYRPSYCIAHREYC